MCLTRKHQSQRHMYHLIEQDSCGIMESYATPQTQGLMCEAFMCSATFVSLRCNTILNDKGRFTHSSLATLLCISGQQFTAWMQGTEAQWGFASSPGDSDSGDWFVGFLFIYCEATLTANCAQWSLLMSLRELY